MTLHKVLVGSLLFVFGCLCAAQRAEIKKVPIKNIDASDGEKMYSTYCAACHGKDGKGIGPAAASLKTSPADLTTLAERNNGNFPELAVYQTILGDNAIASHGNKDMPVWGGLFSSLCTGARTPQPEIQMRVGNLTRYVKSLQR